MNGVENYRKLAHKANVLYEYFEEALASITIASVSGCGLVRRSHNGVTVTQHHDIAYYCRLFGVRQNSFVDIPLLFKELGYPRMNFVLTPNPYDFDGSAYNFFLQRGATIAPIHVKLGLSLSSKAKIAQPMIHPNFEFEVLAEVQAAKALGVIFYEIFSKESSRENHSILEELFSIDGLFAHVYRFGGDVIGFSILLKQEDAAYLAGAGVRLQYRSMGFHKAMIHSRIEHAYELGCQELFGAANFGTISMANMMTMGMSILTATPSIAIPGDMKR